MNKFINFVLRYIANLDIPVKRYDFSSQLNGRGTFVEFRSGMLNISPIGRNCSQAERDAFFMYDKEHHIRETMVEALKKEFPDYGFVYLIGGQISFDIVPKGWDKTYCLQFLKDYDEIHFFGDRTQPVGVLVDSLGSREVMTMRFSVTNVLLDILSRDPLIPSSSVRNCSSKFLWSVVCWSESVASTFRKQTIANGMKESPLCCLIQRCR